MSSKPSARSAPAVRHEPIAIVGMACRFPGAPDVAALWSLLDRGGDAIATMPARQLGFESLVDARPGNPGSIVTLEGGFLENVDQFDAGFFGISPREAVLLDPQQRLLLEVAWEGLEAAGIPPDRLAGTKTGVFVGMWTNEYEDYVYARNPDIDLYATTGGGRHSASGRLSYAFDFRGPSLTVDTACSSSLVAIHLACASLRTGESQVALAAGVNLILQPHVSIGYSRSRMLSPRARCRFGDASADGYVRSEGVGLLVLKPLSRALADGDAIQGTILGSAANNDGRASDLLVAPAVKGQAEMLAAAYADAAVAPSRVQYVEAHGTGTRVGDPVEIEALSSVLSIDRAADDICLLGSIKTNIGHTEAASGIAGVIKVVLAMQHGVVPASLHLREPNPSIPWERVPLAIVSERRPWPSTGAPKIAGVNSFGITGSNAHVVLGEAPARERPEVPTPPAYLLALSAHSEAARAELARRYVEALRSAPDGTLGDMAHTAARRRTHHAFRATVAGHERADLIDKLDALARGEARTGLSAARAVEGPHSVAFVFPGQGSQWVGMGRALKAAEPVFAEAIARCDAAVRALTGWSVVDALDADEADSPLARIDVVQPVLFSIQVALAALWRSWGVEPTAVVGHSMGEVAAAHVAGALSLDDAATIICRRSALLRRTSGKGAMAVVELSLDEARAALAGHESKVSVAVSNSTRSTVVSGDPAALETVLAGLEARGIFCRRVNVDVASHSPQMDPLKDDLLAAVAGIAPREAALTFLSTVRATPIDGASLSAAYWVDNLREPVLFADAVRQLLALGIDTFVEMSAHPLLVSAIRETAAEDDREVVVVGSVRRDEDEVVGLRESAGTLHCHGRTLAWDALVPDGRVVSLPSLPWQRERFWFDAPAQASAEPGAPLRSARLSSREPHVRFFDLDVAIATSPYLTDHRVRGAIVVPAAWYLAVAHDAARATLAGATLRFEDVTIEQALVLSDDRTHPVQVTLEITGPETASFRVASRDAGSPGVQESAWTTHARGVVRAVDDAGFELVDARPTTPAAVTFDTDAHYRAMSRRGLEYGGAFRRVGGGSRWPDRLVCRLVDPGALPPDGPFQRETTLLDGALQTVVAALPDGAPGDTFVPVAIASLLLHDDGESTDGLSAVVTRVDTTSADASTFEADVQWVDAHQRVRGEARRVRLQCVERERDRQLRDALYRLAWRRKPIDQAADAPVSGNWLVVGEDTPLARGVARRLGKRGASVVSATPASEFRDLAPDRVELDFSNEAEVARLIDAVAPLTGVAHVGSLRDGFPASESASALAAIDLIRVLLRRDEGTLPRCWFVTAGTQAAGDDTVVRMSGSSLWGLRAVVASESPRLRCSACDLPGDPSDASLDALVAELLTDAADDEVALRDGQRYVRTLERGIEDPARYRIARPAAGRPYRAMTTSPGTIDAIALEAAERRPPSADQVEIEVQAVGLNFMNVMSALGVYPGYPQGVGPLGIECAGRVVRVGADVPGLEVGDAVLAFAHDCLATHALAHRSLVSRIPDGMGFTAAASIPIAFLTAYYALVQLARIMPGDRVLIHAAAGGVGLAALQVARAAGAEIYATAGTDEKRALLRSLGVAHVSDSRSLAFVDDIRRASRGEGVDVVLNSLAGEAIAAGLSLLRAGGRFVEIGKRDIYENRAIGLLPFQRNLSYFAVDLDRMARERPDWLGRHLREVVEKVVDGTYSPLPTETFPVAHAADAFRRMAQGAHTGKLVIEIDAADAPVHPRLTAMPDEWGAGTILVTGGTGALGLAVSRWLVDRGARRLVLVSRRGAGRDSAAAIDALRAGGADVRVVQGDVARLDDVTRIVGDIAASSHPIVGVIHAAGLLDDATVERIAHAQFERVAAPKIAGAWNLHTATADQPIAFFVLFSSVAAFLGLSGQGAYAASNAALDALAPYRRAKGLPAISIGWGPWAEVGLAAEQENRGARLAESGLGSLAPDLGIAAFEEILRANPAHVAVMPFDARRWTAAYPASAARPLFAGLMAADSGATPDAPADAPAAGIATLLRDAPPGRRRRTLVESFVQQQVALVLKLAPARIDTKRPLRTMGLDSLMGLELRNRLEAGTGATLPATLIWNYPTVEALAPELAARMGVAIDEAAESPAAATGHLAEGDADVEALLREIDALSDEDARRLLAGGEGA